ncbi:MAG TPA: polyprenyl synthetase family protein, partial [Fimbriimonadaceae bacterium]|nr:polyprenyl synthetase family protein [Fimbriimonadaceae bacterium]
MGAETLLKAYRDVVEPRLAELLPSESTEPKRLHETMRYASLAPGKRLRPALCLASCKAVGSETSQALDAACAIEIVHCFSLVHDDLPAIDNDLLRRGIPSCHARFGEALALLAGDALFALA